MTLAQARGLPWHEYETLIEGIGEEFGGEQVEVSDGSPETLTELGFDMRTAEG
jgi:hypothetical protein